MSDIRDAAAKKAPNDAGALNFIPLSTDQYFATTGDLPQSNL
ncbi:MAG: hypothetical protein WBF03_16085 [Xanthobacteraceae bacterium]|jgi:hypothetical protein